MGSLHLTVNVLTFMFQNICNFVRHSRPSATSSFQDVGRILYWYKSSSKSDQHPKQRRACDNGLDIICSFLKTEKLLALKLRTRRRRILVFNNSRSQAVFASSALHVLDKKKTFELPSVTG